MKDTAHWKRLEKFVRLYGAKKDQQAFDLCIADISNITHGESDEKGTESKDISK